MSLKTAVSWIRSNTLNHAKIPPRFITRCTTAGFFHLLFRKTNLSVANGVPLGHAQQLRGLKRQQYYDSQLYTVALTDF